MKVLFGAFSQETNAFAVGKSDFKRLTSDGWYVGEEIITAYKNTGTFLGGILDSASENDIEMIPSIAVEGYGPPLTDECLRFVTEQATEIAKKNASTIDGVVFEIHGAGCSENEDSIEIYFIKELRKILGDNIPIMVVLDLHGNVSKELVEITDGIFGIKEYPHIDNRIAGKRCMDAMVCTLRDKVKYNTYFVKIPLMVSCLSGGTFVEPMKEIKTYIESYEKQHNLIDATFFHGFPYENRAHIGASIVVVSESDAERETLELAEYVWSKRNVLCAKSISAREAVDKAIKSVSSDGYVLIADTSDNAGGGAPADGTHLLREILQQNNKRFLRCIFAGIYDPKAAHACNEAGIGGHVSFQLGGFTQSIHGEPIEIKDAEVLALSNGKSKYISPAWPNGPCELGLTARIKVNSTEIIIISALLQTLDDRPYLLTGADLNQYDIVALKSTHHYMAYFGERANVIIPCDPPGIQTANFSILDFNNVPKEMYPLNKDFEWSPDVIVK